MDAVCRCGNRDSLGPFPSFAIHPHGHYRGATVYPVWGTDDLAHSAQLNPPYHATKLYCPAHLPPQLLWTFGQEEGQYFEDSLEKVAE